MRMMLKAAAAGLVLATVTGVVSAQPHTRVTVTKTRGPMKVLPHHRQKLCQVRYVHQKRVKKCWYR